MEYCGNYVKNESHQLPSSAELLSTWRLHYWTREQRVEPLHKLGQDRSRNGVVFMVGDCVVAKVCRVAFWTLLLPGMCCVRGVPIKYSIVLDRKYLNEPGSANSPLRPDLAPKSEFRTVPSQLHWSLLSLTYPECSSLFLMCDKSVDCTVYCTVHICPVGLVPVY